MKEQIKFRQGLWIVCLCMLAGLVSFVRPPSLLASPPNVILTNTLHFPTTSGNPATLGPGKYFVEQAGSSELLLTSVADKKEFLIQAEALNHEQYELFSPMALSRPSENQEQLIDLYLPGGVRLQAKGNSKKLPNLHPRPKAAPIPQSAETPPPANPNSTVAAINPNPKTPALPPQILQIPSSSPSLPTMGQALPLIPYQAPTPDRRGVRIDAKNASGQFPSIFVLAPHHVGQTSQEHPVLFWYLSRNTQDPLDVMIAEEGKTEVLLDIRLLPPLHEGIHELRLGDYGISLVAEVPYRWTVRIMSKKSSENLMASGVIRRINSPETTSKSMSYSPERYAQKGLWYDAFTSLNDQNQLKPGNPEILAKQASLLNQIGLEEVAAFVQQNTTQ